MRCIAIRSRTALRPCQSIRSLLGNAVANQCGARPCHAMRGLGCAILRYASPFLGRSVFCLSWLCHCLSTLCLCTASRSSSIHCHGSAWLFNAVAFRCGAELRASMPLLCGSGQLLAKQCLRNAILSYLSKALALQIVAHIADLCAAFPLQCRAIQSCPPRCSAVPLLCNAWPCHR